MSSCSSCSSVSSVAALYAAPRNSQPVNALIESAKEASPPVQAPRTTIGTVDITV